MLRKRNYGLEYTDRNPINQSACSECSAVSGAPHAASCRHSPIFTNDPLLGTAVADRYEIIAVIGIGGWSTVYEAKDKVLNRPVALKVLHSHHAMDQQKLHRFQREAQAASLLAHPSVAAIFDYGTLDQGRPYIVMEFVQGKTLADLLKEGQRLSSRESVGLFSQVCDGLDAAHKIGLIHRDLKPSNIMITGPGNAKTLDFGIAKWTLQDANDLTKSGEVLGTPSYMSPEQCLGSTDLDGRADIYALGCVMYEASTGIKAFPCDQVLDCLSNQIKVMPRRLKAIAPAVDAPLSLESAIFKALAKNPGDRFQSMSDMKAALTSSQQKITPMQHALYLLALSPITKKHVSIVLAVAVVCLSAYLGVRKWTTPEDQRTIRFPDRPVGTVYLISRDSKGIETRREKYAAAQGPISVPKGALVQLKDVPLQEISLDFLANLGPDDLQYLDFIDTPLSDQALSAIGRLKGLQSVNFVGTDISDQGLRQLDLPMLGGLDLTRTKITDKGVSYIAALLKRIRWLSLEDTKVTDSGLPYLINLNSLATLRLDHSQVTDSGMTQIKRLRKLSTLELAGDNITDAGLSILSEMSTLRELDLRETKITDRSIDVLCRMGMLERLNVSGTSISASGISRLKQNLPRCVVIE
jgi:serine/threonine protein kinase